MTLVETIMVTYMKKLVRTYEPIMCMSNLRGNMVKVPGKLDFSFYFSSRDGNNHGIRVKPLFNPERMRENLAGNLELHGDYDYTPGPDDTNVPSSKVSEMRNFFRYYKVLFAGVWENVMEASEVQDYFRGIIDFDQMLKGFDFYDVYVDELSGIHSIEELEAFVRNNNIFNMND